MLEALFYEKLIQKSYDIGNIIDPVSHVKKQIRMEICKKVIENAQKHLPGVPLKYKIFRVHPVIYIVPHLLHFSDS